MKNSSLLLISLFIVINAHAIDESVFEERYPGFQDYQSLSLQGLKNYFSTLFSKSIAINGQKNFYLLRVQDDVGTIISNINVRIERFKNENSIVERVHFTLSNARTFSYTLSRYGANLVENSDIDLITFNFKSNGESYELALNQLETRFLVQRISKDLEKSYILMGVFEINTLIETILEKDSARRNYIVFYKNLPSPQSMLTVMAFNGSAAPNLNYVHVAKGLEIAPKYFFNSLNDFAGIYFDFSQVSLMTLSQMGFPAINGIN